MPAASVTLKLRQGDIDRLEKKLFKAVELVSTKRARNAILGPGATIVAKVVQRETPIGKRKETPRRTKGGRMVYVRGNLRKSVRWLRKLKRGRKITIGPLYNRNGGNVRGKNKRTADGYYAHMVFGSARGFRSNVAIKGLNKSRARALAAIERRMTVEMRKAGRKLFR